MKYSALAFLAVSGLSCSISQAEVIELSDFGPDAVLLNFDELPSVTTPTGTIVGDLYEPLGVVFQNAHVRKGVFGPHILWVSEPNTVQSLDRSLPLSVIFPDGALRVGINIDADGFNDTVRQPKMRIYDTMGALIAEEAFEQGPAFIGYESSFSRPIGHILLGSTFPSNPAGPLEARDGHDNLIFESVPEPSTAALLWCAILFGLLKFWRRMRPAKPV